MSLPGGTPKGIILNRDLEEGVTYWEGQELDNLYEVRVRLRIKGRILSDRRFMDRFELENSIFDFFGWVVGCLEDSITAQAQIAFLLP